ncbi:MAG: hypothetical protein ABSG88_18005 [Bradyrhizobium sp.]
MPGNFIPRNSDRHIPALGHLGIGQILLSDIDGGDDVGFPFGVYELIKLEHRKPKTPLAPANSQNPSSWWADFQAAMGVL